ncbi:MAG: NAD(P)-dependent oxidoreductase, partial [Hyphomicrobiaceae bacterium]
MKLISRKPAETPPPHMQALAKLPIFLDLSGKRAVVAGAGPAAAWKAELLAAAGAQVDVFSAHPGEEMLAL